MIIKAHESVDYQDFLTSDYRELSVPADAYLKILRDQLDEPLQILDFGCGLGYVSLLLGEQLKKNSQAHIYACDYQEDLIDLLWKRLVHHNLKNVTPFHIPDRSLVNFPKWIPGINHFFFSFSLSAVEDAFKVFNTIKSILSETAVLHIFDWEHDANNEYLNKVFPKEDRLTAMILQQWLELTGYKVTRTESSKGKDYFYLEAELFAP